MHKPWYIATNCPHLAAEMSKYKCLGCPAHAPCEGADTEGSGFYVKKLAQAIHRGWARSVRVCGGAAAASIADDFSDGLTQGVNPHLRCHAHATQQHIMSTGRSISMIFL